MVYVVLGSMTEETHCALFTIIKQILPPNYDHSSFVTDYEKSIDEYGKLNVSPNRLVCRWFHYTQIRF